MPTVEPTPKVIFFDAVGTLFHLPRGVGYHYALVGQRMGLTLAAESLDHAFAQTWKTMPVRRVSQGPRPDDDKGWWRALVDRVLDEVAPQTQPLDRDTFFEAAYAHFAEAGVWELYPETEDVLAQLRERYPLAVISNFDGRLRVILEHFGLSKFFRAVVVSSEVGADKPDPLIFQRALELTGALAANALHVGDDPVRDWQGATAAGLRVFQLERPRQSLRDLLPVLGLQE